MPRWFMYVLLMALFLLMASLPLAKQFDTGSIWGVVSDQVGPVPQALVEARDLATGTILDAESDLDGAYLLDNLHSGKYSLWVQAPYHDSLWIQQIAVERGQTVHHDIYLARTSRQTFNVELPGSPSPLASR